MPYSPASSRGSSGGGVSSGTANPVGPAAGDLFYRTDLQQLIEYDGTRWLTVTQYRTPMGVQYAVATNSFSADVNVPASFDMWIESVEINSFVATTNTGAAFWSMQLSKYNAANVATTIGAAATTAADAPDVNVNKTITIGAAVGGVATWKRLILVYTKTGAPGNMSSSSTLVYRLIVT